MNYTENYSLPQWEDTDRVTRESVNGAMAAVDSAIAGASPWVKLLDVTLGADTTRYDLDVSGIDLTQYAMVYIRPWLTSSSTNTCPFYCNGQVGSHYQSRSATRSDAGSVGVLNAGDEAEIRIFGNETRVHFYTVSHLMVGSVEQEPVSPNPSVATGTTLRTINFIPSSNYTLKAGSRIVVYGLKK